jgi:epoxyqueuosine reductase
MTIEKNTQFIKETARQLGFDYCGISTAGFLAEDATRLERWLNKGMHGSMQYMENNFDLRTDPTKLVPGAKSVITLMLNYFSESLQKKDATENKYRISKYAYGQDYHEVIKKKLHEFLHRINQEIGEVNGRGFVDSAPVLERAWAQKSGLGFIGKNGNLINKQQGSFFFLATLISDLELVADNPLVKDFCGTCTKCIDTCPTDAILPGKIIDGSKCISYFTIELKEMMIPSAMQGKFDNWIFGCDACQDVCPWNRFSKPTSEKSFTPIAGLLDLTNKEWEELTQDQFKQLLKDSPIKRSKYDGLKRNIAFIKSGQQPN